MRPGDPSDPLLRQVMPLAAELAERPGFGPDPLGEREAFKAPGLLQKYQGRALLIATGACAINCRYCFRREFPYSEQVGNGALGQALDAIAADPGIEEVILSGGDPLSLSDGRLRALTDLLAPIPHLRRLRVHTRLPVVLPARVDAGLLSGCATCPGRWRWCCTPTMATKSMMRSVRRAPGCARRARRLLNQSVLLRGVNDSVAALSDLSQRLFEPACVPTTCICSIGCAAPRTSKCPKPPHGSWSATLAATPLRLPGAAPGA